MSTWTDIRDSVNPFARPKQPAPPDATQLIGAQAQANRINEVTPYGSSAYTQGPDGQWTRTTTLNPNLQGTMDAQQGAGMLASQYGQQQLPGTLQATGYGQALDLSGLPAQATGINYDQNYGRMFDAYTARMDPVLQRDEERLRTQLHAQGITEGSEAWRNRMDDFSRSKNDAYQAASRDAFKDAYGVGTTEAGLQNLARQQGLSETMLSRQVPVSEIQGLFGLTPQQTPTFGATPQIDTTSPYALQYQGMMNNYNQANANFMNNQSGLFGIGGAVAGALPWGQWFGGG